jgi:hypothetical protein
MLTISIVLFSLSRAFSSSDPTRPVAYSRPTSHPLSTLTFHLHSAWSLPKELTPLKKHEITAYLQAPSKKKKGDLFAAYEIAEDPKEWLETRASGAGGEDEDMEVEDEDELAEEVDEEPEESAGKKRKRGGEKKASGAADNKAKKAKLEKLAKSKKVSLANRFLADGFVRLSEQSTIADG